MNKFKKTIKKFIKPDKDYVFLVHSLKAGETIERHCHKYANEWLVIDSGRLSVEVGKKKKSYDLKNKITVIKFPVGVRHSLIARSDIFYLVFRDKKDKMIYV